MTQFEAYSTTTPRNDPSPGHGHRDLADAYRYYVEAYGGYHFNVMHGINVDAGIFIVLYRPVQLLQFRQLGLSTFIRFLEHALVF